MRQHGMRLESLVRARKNANTKVSHVFSALWYNAHAANTTSVQGGNPSEASAKDDQLQSGTLWILIFACWDQCAHANLRPAPVHHEFAKIS